MKYLFLIFCLTTLMSCSESDDVEQAFTVVTNRLGIGDRERIKRSFDQETHDYVGKLVACARNREAERALLLGRQNVIPISTMILYYSMAGTEEQVDTSSVYSEDYLWTYFRLDGTGVFRHSAKLPIKIYEEPFIFGDIAKLEVSIPAEDNARLLTTYLFNREEDIWKLNLPSTMGVMEKIHKQNQKKSGLDMDAYARRASSMAGSSVKFEYRKYYR